MRRKNNLQSFYESLDKLGLDLTEEQIAKIKEQEREIIQKDILPAAVDSLKQSLLRVRFDFSALLVYRHDSGSGKLYVVRCKEDGTSEEVFGLLDFCTKQNDIVEKVKNSGRQKLIVLLNGKQVGGNNQASVFAETIRQIGVRSVRQLGLRANGIELVGTTNYPNKSQKKVGSYFVSTCMNAEDKVDKLKAIARALKLDLTIRLE